MTRRRRSPSLRFRQALNLYGSDLAIPVREYKFHPVRKWPFDFAWPEAKLAVEIQGGTYKRIRGRHSRGPGQHNDFDKYNAAQLLGWRVVLLDSNHLSSIRKRKDVISLLRKFLLHHNDDTTTDNSPRRLPSRSKQDPLPHANSPQPLRRFRKRVD